MAEPIKVLIRGALGRMGQEVLYALSREPGLEPVGAVDTKATEDYLSFTGGMGLIPLSPDLETMLARCRPSVMVDFSVVDGLMPALRIAAKQKVNLVVGTTGLSPKDLDEVKELCQKNGVGAIVAPNFALGAVLMTRLCRLVARYFEYADVSEAHHEKKADAPSGTALSMARAIAEGRGQQLQRPHPQKETLAGTTGGELRGVGIHSIRMPGVMAYHEVVFGAPGQTLRIQHDTINRECYIPGVVLAIKEVVNRKELLVGLENLLDL